MKLLAIAALVWAPLTLAQSLAGLWDATVKVGDLVVPFRFQISGDAKFVSSSGSYANGALTINWDYTASKLEATVRDGVIEGSYFRAGRDAKTVYPFQARRFSPSPLTT